MASKLRGDFGWCKLNFEWNADDTVFVDLLSIKNFEPKRSDPNVRMPSMPVRAHGHAPLPAYKLYIGNEKEYMLKSIRSDIERVE